MTMEKIAFLFPGQGAQYKGMGKDLLENFSEARDIFDIADASLPFSMRELCLEDSNDLLNQTKYTQPAILTVSMAAFAVLKSRGVHPHFYAGLSLGEYTALVASGIIDFKTGVQLVYNRGTFMEEAVPNGKGAMAAIMGLDNELVEQVCNDAKNVGIVEPANYNYTGQVVIGGEKHAVEYASEQMIKNGAKRAIPLNVSGPFHTSMLKKAAVNLQEYLSKLTLNQWDTPVISNITGKPYDNLHVLKDLLTNQVVSPVQWESSMHYIINNGITHFVEVGPGKVLSGFLKKINRSVKIMHVEDKSSLEETLKILGG